MLNVKIILADGVRLQRFDGQNWLVKIPHNLKVRLRITDSHVAGVLDGSVLYLRGSGRLLFRAVEREKFD